MFFLRNESPQIKSQMLVKNESFEVLRTYHIKFTSFQSYFTSIDFQDSDLKEGKVLYTKDNFLKRVGRRKRNGNNWQDLQDFFDEYFKEEYDWRKRCQWIDKIEKSNRSQFDIAFGYDCSVLVPYALFQSVDNHVGNLYDLSNFLNEIKCQMISIVE